MTDAAAPLELRRGTSWANRLALAPLTNKQSEADGTLGVSISQEALLRVIGA